MELSFACELMYRKTGSHSGVSMGYGTGELGTNKQPFLTLVNGLG